MPPPVPAFASSAASPFTDLMAAMACAPLHEAAPARSGDGTAAWGFALALGLGLGLNPHDARRPLPLARARAGPPLIFVCARTWTAEEGMLSPRGLCAFGLDPARVLGVHVRTGKEALWASEQALEVPGATVVCALADRDVDLTASRRLLLKAERTGARALLVRAGAGDAASAAHTRWRIAAAPSAAPGRLLGPPAWRATLLRRRGGAAGMTFDLTWSGHDRSFRAALAGDLPADAVDGSPARAAHRAA